MLNNQRVNPCALVELLVFTCVSGWCSLGHQEDQKTW
jgi:hypothetical protein